MYKLANCCFLHVIMIIQFYSDHIEVMIVTVEVPDISKSHHGLEVNVCVDNVV